jgi:hypothetical protein
MNTELNSVRPSAPLTAAHHLTVAHHLTEEQFGELLCAPPRTGVQTPSPEEAHIQSCEQCAAELAGLRESLLLFRDASTAFADDQLRHLPPMHLPARTELAPALWPAYLATAAALLLAAFLPMQILWQRASRPAPQARISTTSRIQVYAKESNEALLNDIDREVSASVPDSMQALADPTLNADFSGPNSNQRKD